MGVLHRVFVIGVTNSYLKLALWFLNLNNQELCLVRHEPISMTNIFIRCSSPGLFAGGVKEIRGMVGAGSAGKFLLIL